MSLCKLCQEPANVIVTTVDEGSNESETEVYCPKCAVSLGIPVMSPDETPYLHRSMDRLRWEIDFIKKYHRLPNSQEYSTMGVCAKDVPPEAFKATLAEQLHWLELSLQFMETNHRFPDEGDLPPDPFLTS
jgi:protein-arginine kinase activator protein McsA